MTTHKDALRKMAGEVGGLKAFEYEIRHAIGNTNWELLMKSLEDADEALAAQPEQQPVAWRIFRSGRWCFAYSPNRCLCDHDEWEPLYASPIETAANEGWISVEDRLPETIVIDDSECWLQGRRISASIASDRVLVALSEGGVRVDRLEGLEGKPPFWGAYGERVVAWQPLPAAPQPQQENKA